MFLIYNRLKSDSPLINRLGIFRYIATPAFFKLIAAGIKVSARGIIKTFRAGVS